MTSVLICGVHQKGKSHKSIVICLQCRTQNVGKKDQRENQLGSMSHPTQRWSSREEYIAVREVPQDKEVNKTFEHYCDFSKAFPSAASIQHLYTNGFHVYPNLRAVRDEIVTFLKTQNHSQVLFNDGCKKRLMYNLSPEVVGKVSRCSDVADFVNKINEKTVADTWASLWSLSST